MLHRPEVSVGRNSEITCFDSESEESLQDIIDSLNDALGSLKEIEKDASINKTND